MFSQEIKHISGVMSCFLFSFIILNIYFSSSNFQLLTVSMNVNSYTMSIMNTFSNVNFPFICREIPAAPAFPISFSQLIR